MLRKRCINRAVAELDLLCSGWSSRQSLAVGLPVSIFTLDTGRLFAETYSVWSATNEKYGARIQAYYPSRDLLEKLESLVGRGSVQVVYGAPPGGMTASFADGR